MALTKKEKELQKQESIERLSKILTSGMDVKSVCTGYPRSGMGGRYRFFVAIMAKSHRDPNYPDCDPIPTVEEITGDMSNVLGWKWTEDGSLYVSGCGLNRPHHAVSSLASILRHSGKLPEDFQLKHDGW